MRPIRCSDCNDGTWRSSMSAEIFELILAGVVVTALFWIFWRKGKSD